MIVSFRRVLIPILKIIIPIFIYGCGQSIGYKEVESEIRYYHSTTPEWLPSAAGPGIQHPAFIRLENVNKSKFEILGSVAKDDRTVWFEGKPILGADPGSFLNLEGPYQKDQLAVYFDGVPFESVKPEHFEVIKSKGWIAYARSDEEVFFREKSLNVNSIKNFEFIQGFDLWARDGLNYFLLERKITSGNYDDIKIINNSCYKDQSFVYHVDGNIDTLIFEKGDNIEIPSLDILTIEKTEHSAFLKDKFGYIDVHSKKRISIDDYKFQLKHND
ncbi:MAG: hypothetical protein ACJA08_000641 [Cyclobacteriaceae bacterium]|jgi:hypothetical protein